MFPDNCEMNKTWEVAFFYHELNSKVQVTIQTLQKSDRIYNVTFRDQDYIPGVSVQEESFRLMSNSKSIIFFLSDKFFKCQQCCEELKLAICTPIFSKR